jgi:type II secretory pathway component PulF
LFGDISESLERKIRKNIKFMLQNFFFLALKNLLEKQAKLIKILKNALIYPSILCVFAFLIVNALIFFIIPSLKELFEGRQVTGLTAGILFVSNWCVNHVNLLICLIL